MANKALKIIRASAGSGKTFSLTAHYLLLLFGGKTRFREILAVTFTNKATAEMKSRILGALRELADDTVSRPKFMQVILDEYPSLSADVVRLKAHDIYRAILHDYSRFAVSTIDGFVQQVIRSFAFELNLESGYRLEMNEQKVKDELVKGLNRRMEKDPSLLEWVTSLAIERINDGKDWNYERALDEIAGEIFKERYFPFQEAMRTLDGRQASAFDELKTTLAGSIAGFKDVVTDMASRANTLFSGSGLVSDELDGKSRSPLLKLQKVAAGDFTAVTALGALVDDFSRWPHKSLKDTAVVEALYKELNPLLKELSEFYNGGIAGFETARSIYKNTPYLRLMQEMAELVSEYRTRNRALLISDAQNLLKGVTGEDADNPSFIWEKTGNRYRHFLFDEFQDTSGFQWANFLPLIRNAVASHESGDYPGHLVVGDVKQSIYRWRNGDWRILHEQAAFDLGSQFITEHNLEYNRRSSENIVNFNNFLYTQLPRFLQDTFNDELGKYSPGIADRYSSLIAGCYEGSLQKTTADTLPGGRILLELIPRNPAEDAEPADIALERMAEKISGLLGSGECRMKDIGILVKKNSEGEEVIRYLLSRQAELSRAAGKTFQLISGEALRVKNDLAVQLIVTSMKLLSVREEEQGIFRATCARLYFEIHHPDTDDIAIGPAGWMRLARDPLERLTGLLPHGQTENPGRLLGLPLVELVEELIGIYGLNALGHHLPYLLAFRDLLGSFAASGDLGMLKFLEWWETDGQNKSLPSADDQDAVTVMTVHKSKGLEFKAVLLPFCNWEINQFSGFLKKILWVDAAKGGFPDFGMLPVDYSSSLSSTGFAENYFEELLLNYMDTLNTLYVATTRARNYLCILSPQKATNTNNLYKVFNTIFGGEGPGNNDFILEDGRLDYGERVRERPEAAAGEQGKVMLESYPLNDFSRLYSSAPVREAGWFNEQQRMGTVLHELLAQASSAEELDLLVSQHTESGDLRSDEREMVLAAAMAVFDHPQISQWMHSSDRVISENTILAPGGGAERPDKVFVIGDTAVLLDFKFGSPKPGHKRQLDRYKDLLISMGEYREVSAYLWYAESKTLTGI